MNTEIKTPRTQALRERDYEADVAVWLHAEDLELETVALKAELEKCRNAWMCTNQLHARETSDSIKLTAELARVTAERNDYRDRIAGTERDIAKAIEESHNLRARVAELETAVSGLTDALNRTRHSEQIIQQRNQKLVAALREEKRIHPQDFLPGDFRERALARAESVTPVVKECFTTESGTPAKHPDTEIVDYLAGMWDSQGKGHHLMGRWFPNATGSFRDAVAARKQGGA